MRCTSSRRLLSALLLLLLGIRPAAAQEVTVDLSLPPYELVYLSDFIDPISLDLLPTIERVAVYLGGTGEIQLVLNTYLQSRQKDEELVGSVFTRPFAVMERPVITAIELTDPGLVPSGQSYFNETLADELEEELYEEGIPVAPIGYYRIVAMACRPGTVTPGADPTTGNPNAFGCPNPLAQAQGQTEIRYESVAEAMAIPLSPPDGAALSTPQPLFQWLLPNPGATGRFRLWRREAYHLSVEEALDAPPLFEMAIAGQTTLFYTGGVPLEPGYTYYWTIDAGVLTSSGEEFNPTRVYSFTVSDAAAAPEYLLSVLYQFGGEVPEALDALQADGWRPAGTFLLDGRSLSPEELGQLADEVREFFGPAQADVVGAEQ